MTSNDSTAGIEQGFLESIFLLVVKILSLLFDLGIQMRILNVFTVKFASHYSLHER